MESKLPEEINNQILDQAACVKDFFSNDGSIDNDYLIGHHQGYIEGSKQWAQWKIKYDETVALLDACNNGWADKYKSLQDDYIKTLKEFDGKKAGVIAEGERAQKQIKMLSDVLEQILHAPVPATALEYMSWFVTAKNIAGGAISNLAAEREMQQWNEGKEVGG